MAIFEAPIAHEAAHYSNPEGSYYNSPELEFESEEEASSYSNPYTTPEMEFEEEASSYTNPYSAFEMESEDESDRFLPNILSGVVRGIFGGGGEEGEVGHELEHEFEDEASHYSTPEMELEEEADHFFFGNISGLIGRIRRHARWLAQRARALAPMVTRVVSSIASESHPMADRMINALVQEAEMEVAHMENHFTNTYAQTGEAEYPEVHEALQSELMAANAAAAQTEAEAEAMLAATIPLTIRFMRAQRTLLPVTPALVQANARVVRVMRRRGHRQLLRLLPAIHRNTVAILRLLGRRQRITTPVAMRAMAIATRRVMQNPRRAERAIQRNIALQVRASRMNRSRGSLPLRPVPRRQGLPVY